MQFQTIYDINQFGFLSHDIPLNLPFEFDEYKEIVNNLNSTDAKYFRHLVEKIGSDPYYPNNYSSILNKFDNSTVKLVYSIFSLIVQKYLWCEGKGKNPQSIPYETGIIWHNSSIILGIPCSCTYASVVLYNCVINEMINKSIIDKVIDGHITIPNFFDLINVSHTITGYKDEVMFYKIHMAIELVGGKFVSEYCDMMLGENSQVYNRDKVLKFLESTSKIISKLNQILGHMFNSCDPNVFWNVLRIFLGGYDNEESFPNGLEILNTGIKLRTKGGSGASSTLIQLLDVCFGISHDSAHAQNLLRAMREYMPAPHTKLLIAMENDYPTMATWTKYFDIETTNQYNKCLNNLGNFRHSHVNMVHKYIVNNLGSKSNNVYGERGTSGIGTEITKYNPKVLFNKLFGYKFSHPIEILLKEFQQSTLGSKIKIIDNDKIKKSYKIPYKVLYMAIPIIIFLWYCLWHWH